jgi:hypothetical protein
MTTTELDYTQRMNADINWALREGGMFFQNESEVQKSLRRITARLNDLGIDYAVVGGMALFLHGFRRFTEDVDILVTREGLAKLHEALEGSGYRPPFAGSKNLRDTDNGVRIEFLVAGEFPGDGKVKPVAFPEPENVTVEQDGIRLLNLAALIELKLASGITGGIERSKDITDVVEVVKMLRLPEAMADQLDPFVRERYREIWLGLEAARKQREADGLLEPQG